MTQPANATELCGLANDRPCITGEWGHTARELKKGPWKWKQSPRAPIAERQISMTREEALKASFTKGEKQNVDGDRDSAIRE
jgi:hypothetical protein